MRAVSGSLWLARLSLASLLACAGCTPAPPPAPAPVDPFADRLGEVQRLFASGDVPAAVALLQRLAEEGSTAAQLQLASLYRRGLGVPRDPGEAIRFLERAAAAGSPAALRELGEAYREGLGVPRDPARGLALLRRAAEAGDPGHACSSRLSKRTIRSLI